MVVNWVVKKADVKAEQLAGERAVPLAFWSVEMSAGCWVVVRAALLAVPRAAHWVA